MEVAEVATEVGSSVRRIGAGSGRDGFALMAVRGTESSTRVRAVRCGVGVSARIMRVVVTAHGDGATAMAVDERRGNVEGCGMRRKELGVGDGATVRW